MIDIHTHLHPAKLFVAIRRWFADNSPWKLVHPSDPEDIAQALKGYGVERFVFCSYAHRTGMARDLNAWLTSTAKQLNYQGLPLLTVHPDDPDFLQDAVLALDNGCIGLKIHEDVQAFGVDDPRLTDLYSLLLERNAFVLAHIGPIPWRRIPQEGFMRVSTVMKKHPDLKFVIAHMGAPDTRNYLQLLKEHPHLYLDTTLAFAKLTANEVPLNPEEVEAHADQIVYGSDYPNTPLPYGEEIGILQGMNLTPSSLKKILHENSARLIEPFVRSVAQ